MRRLFLTKKVSHDDSALLTTNSELYNKQIRRKCCNTSPYIGLAKMSKSIIFDKNFDEIWVLWQMKNNIFCGKIFWSPNNSNNDDNHVHLLRCNIFACGFVLVGTKMNNNNNDPRCLADLYNPAWWWLPGLSVTPHIFYF